MSLRKKCLTYEQQLAEQGVELKRLRYLLEHREEKSNTDIRDYTAELIDLDLNQNVSRYKWNGLPSYIPEGMIETLLYTRGSACMFFKDNLLCILPYAINGKLNIYGYPTSVVPVAINGDRIGYKALNTYPNGDPNKNGKAVIIYDRAPSLLNGLVAPKLVQNRDILELMSKTLIKGEINLDNSTKKMVYEVEGEGQARETRKEVNTALNSSDPFIIVSKNTTSTNKGLFNSGVDNETESIMQFFSSINNYRCYKSGIKNNGVFEKMERVVTGELTGNEYQTNLILETGLNFRKRALKDLMELYPEHRDILEGISVEINIDPYEEKVDSDIENSTYAEKEGTTKEGLEV